jgi:hypothetical protein
MIVTHFGKTTKPLLMVELQGVLEQRQGAGKKPGCFHDAWNEYAVFQKRKNLANTRWITLLHGVIKSSNYGFNLKFLTIDAISTGNLLRI